MVGRRGHGIAWVAQASALRLLVVTTVITIAPLLLAWSARGPRALDVLSSIVLLEDFCFAVSYSGGCPERFFHNLDDAQPTMWLLKNVTHFPQLCEWGSLQHNSKATFPQDSAILPTGSNL